MGQQPLQGFRLVMPTFLCCLHNTHLQPSYLTMNIDPIDIVPRHARRRTCQCCSIHLLSSCKKGSTHSLVKRDPEEVCPLSREIFLFPIHPITRWPLLFPQSFTRTTIGVPYGSLAGIPGGNTGLPCSTSVTGIG